MKNNCLFSIIVPVYNAEKYLNRCIDSILNQTARNFELLLINDGSKDSSGKIIDSYVKSDNRIKCIHKTNGGVSAARNLGLNMAKGDYVTFVDSDDWIESSLLEHCFSIIEKHGVDIIRWGYICEYNDSSHKIVCDKECVTNNVIEMLNLNEECSYYGFVWNTMYKRKTLNGLLFDESLCWLEDHLFTYQAYTQSKSMYMLDRVYYHHTTQVNSLSNIRNPYVIRDAAQKELLVKLKIVKNSPSLSKGFYAAYRNKIAFAIRTCYQTIKRKKERYAFYNTFHFINGGKKSKIETIYRIQFIPYTVKDWILNRFYK